LLALVSSDKVVFVTRGLNWFLVIQSQTTVYQNIHHTFCGNMAISHILEDVNNFIQIFEPALCELKPIS